MAVEHTAQHRPATTVRRAQPAANAPAAAARAVSPATKLQQRLGALGARAFVSRTAEVAPHAEVAPPAAIAPHAAMVPPSAGAPAREHGAASHPAARAPSAGPSASAPGHSAAAPTQGTGAPAAGAAAHHAATLKAGHGTHAAEPAATAGTHAGATTAQAHAALGPLTHAVHQRAQFTRRNTKPTDAAHASDAAQRAAKLPNTEGERGAAVETAKGLDAGDPVAVNKDDFRKQLKKAIKEATTPTPKTEDAADAMRKQGGKQASESLKGNLVTQRDAAAGPMKTAATTDIPATPPKEPYVDVKPPEAGAAPAPVPANPAVPAPLPPERLDYSSDRAPTEQLMAQNNVTPTQLSKGNDQAFGPTIEARSTAEKNEAQAAATYRKDESKIGANALAHAQLAVAHGLGAMHNGRATHLGKVGAQQLSTKSQDAAKRQEITEKITGIKNRTKAAVEGILANMDLVAPILFSGGLARAEQAYDDAFKEAKGGVGTWLTTWGSDWDDLIADSLATARIKYLSVVDDAIDVVAAFVDSKLKEAKDRVKAGHKEVDDYVATLDKHVARFGVEAKAAVQADFDAMGSDIDAHRDALVNKLTEQYKASNERMNAREEELREANKSLWQRVYDATVGLVKKILAFKDMLLSILAKAAGVIADIISDPIGFLGNLIDAVMLGLKNFMSNIGTHLEKGLMDWLFGALSGAGLTLPDSFDLKGIVSIVLQVLGLTYANFRARAVKIVGEPVVAALEQGAEVFKIFLSEGVGGLWRFIKDKVSDLKSMVLDAIFSFIKEKVIIAGVTWIIGLLNPASAFFKACKAIYDIVMFFINRGSQILALVNAVIDSIAEIVKGSLANAAAMVEDALAKAIPVAIGFLASLLGLGDPSKPVRETIEKAQSPVNAAIDWVIHGAAKLVKGAAGAVKGLFSKEDRDKGKEGKPGEKPSRASVKKDVVAELAHQLTSKHSVEQARAIVASVAAGFKPMGVSQILLLGPDAEHRMPIVVEMSPGDEVAFLTPDEALTEKVSVLMKVEFTLAPAEPEEGRITGTVRNQPKPERTDKRPYDYIASVTEHPRTVTRDRSPVGIGGIVFPEEGGKIQLVTWNTNKIERNKWGNETHAERQFESWVDRMSWPDRGSVILNRVTAIHAHLYNYSPCVPCGDALMSVAAKTPNAKGRRNLFWYTLYVSPVSGTTRQEIGMLRGQWNVSGPTEGLEGGAVEGVKVVPKPRRK